MLASELIGPKSPLRALRKQRRLLGDKLVVLVPVDGYYAQKESCRALRVLGHTVVEVVLGERGEPGPLHDNLHKILTAIVQHRPDMMLSINYSGFDRANILGELIEAMGLPTAVWFVDHPMVLATGWLPPSPLCSSFFLWDRSFVPALKALGAERSFHLPLGTDETLFTPGAVGHGGVQPVGFVGHSLIILERRWRSQLDDMEQARAEAMAQALLQDRSCLHTLVPNSEMGPPTDRAAMVLAFGCVLASKRYRLELLRALPQRRLHITGDNHWRELLPEATLHPSTDYGAQSAQVYRDTVINVNATNLQMPSTVNQRLFDVPATGGFLISDHQSEMAELFDVGHGKEMVTFQTADELKDSVSFYSQHKHARQAMAEKARARVLGQHTYTHRLQSLVSTMRKEHRSMQQGSVATPAAALPQSLS